MALALFRAGSSEHCADRANKRALHSLFDGLPMNRRRRGDMVVNNGRPGAATRQTATFPESRLPSPEFSQPAATRPLPGQGRCYPAAAARFSGCPCESLCMGLPCPVGAYMRIRYQIDSIGFFVCARRIACALWWCDGLRDSILHAGALAASGLITTV